MYSEMEGVVEFYDTYELLANMMESKSDEEIQQMLIGQDINIAIDSYLEQIDSLKIELSDIQNKINGRIDCIQKILDKIQKYRKND